MKREQKVISFYAVAACAPLLFYYFPSLFGDPLHPQQQDAISHAPWFALLLTAFLGWRLNQARILFSCAFLLAVLYVLRNPGGSGILGLKDAGLLKSLALCLPLSLCLLFLLREAPLFSRRSGLRLLLALSPLLVLAGLASRSGDPAAFSALLDWTAFPTPGLLLPHASVIALLLYIALCIFQRDARARPFLLALGFSLLPVLLSLEGALDGDSLATDLKQTLVVVSFACSAAILLWAIFSMYWHRVYMDELTGVPNRRALDERLAALEDSYSLAMVDIDHFKKFNDSYGHEEGDNVLRLVAHHLAEGSEHRAYRYGGEEFCLVFQGWDAAKAEGVCDGVRRSLAEREFSIRLPGKIRSKTGAADRGTLKGKSEKVKITLSMGLAQSSPRFPYPHEVIKLADQALYQAKDAGRNRVARAEQKDLK